MYNAVLQYTAPQLAGSVINMDVTLEVPDRGVSSIFPKVIAYTRSGLTIPNRTCDLFIRNFADSMSPHIGNQYTQLNMFMFMSEYDCYR